MFTAAGRDFKISAALPMVDAHTAIIRWLAPMAVYLGLEMPAGAAFLFRMPGGRHARLGRLRAGRRRRRPARLLQARAVTSGWMAFEFQMLDHFIARFDCFDKVALPEADAEGAVDALQRHDVA